MNFWQWYGKGIIKIARDTENILEMVCDPFFEGIMGGSFMVIGVALGTFFAVEYRFLWFLLLIPLGITLVAHASWREGQKQ